MASRMTRADTVVMAAAMVLACRGVSSSAMDGLAKLPAWYTNRHFGRENEPPRPGWLGWLVLDSVG